MIVYLDKLNQIGDADIRSTEGDWLGTVRVGADVFGIAFWHQAISRVDVQAAKNYEEVERIIEEWCDIRNYKYINQTTLSKVQVMK